jgi:hypothetical protein
MVLKTVNGCELTINPSAISHIVRLKDRHLYTTERQLDGTDKEIFTFGTIVMKSESAAGEGNDCYNLDKENLRYAENLLEEYISICRRNE